MNIDEITNQVLKILDKDPYQYIGYNKKITNKSFVTAILSTSSALDAAKLLGINSKFIYSHAPKFTIGLSNGAVTYRYALLSLCKLKLCSLCETIKDYSEFTNSSFIKDGKNTICRNCKNIKQRAYYEQNAEWLNEYFLFRKRNYNRKLTEQEIIEIFKKYNMQCQNCGISNEQHKLQYKQRLHLDHIHPISKGGLNEPENIQLLCRSCNSIKGNRVISP